MSKIPFYMHFLITLLLSFCICEVWAQSVIHLSVQGSDVTGDGSRQRPYASLQKAYQKGLSYQGKDTLYIRLAEGRYELTRPVRINASPDVPVVVEGHADGKTVLSGAKKIKGWMVGPHGCWVAHVEEAVRYGWNFEQLYVNGQRAIRARTPDKGAFLVRDAQEKCIFDGAGRTPSLAVERYGVLPGQLESLQGVGYEQSNRIVANFHHKWSVTRRRVSKVVADSGYVYTSGMPWEKWNPIGENSRLILENYKKALSMPGEWFLDSDGTLFYVPREGETIDDIEVYAPTLQNLLVIKGKKGKPVQNITFRNLSIEHAAYVMPSTGNAPVQAAADISAAVEVAEANHIYFQNCKVRHVGNYAFCFGKSTRDCSLEHSYLSDLGAGAVKIGEFYLPDDESEVVRRIRVENNIIHGTGKIFPSAVGIVIFHAADNQILHNELSDMMYTAISVGWTWGYNASFAKNNEIAFNHIHHVGWGVLSDMGGIYTLGKSPGTRIHHNVIHDICSYDYGGWGIYTDEGSSDIVIEKNLVYNCKSGAFHQHYGRDNLIRNNIFALSRIQQIQLTKAETHRSFTFTNNIILGQVGNVLEGPWEKAKIIMGYNLYWYLDGRQIQFFGKSFRQWQQMKEPSSLWANPHFANPLKGDFHIVNMQNVKKIDFEPFDCSQSGVYGSDTWKRLAEMSPARILEFEIQTQGRMNIANR